MSIFGTQKANDRLQDRLRALEDTVSVLKRDCRSLHLEWEELYDKVRRQMSRMSKRAAVDKREAINGFDEEPPEVDPNAIDPISAAILKRRGVRRPHR